MLRTISTLPWLSIYFVVLIPFPTFAMATGKTPPPNIVLIVSDDQGYRDLGCFGSKEIKTPHLDRLARGGIRLTSFYVSWPACTPSRGSILTGRYPQRNGLYDMIRNEAPDYGHKYTSEEYEVTFERIGGMDTREITLAKMLKDAGYVCGIFGKWDFGTLRHFLPGSRGFDDFYGFVNTGVDYYTHERYGVPSMYRNFEPTTKDKGTYCTDLFKREAIRFLKQNRKKPFFLYLPFNAPHSASNLDPKIRAGAQAPAKYKAMYPQYKETFVKGKRYGKPAMVPDRNTRRLRYLASVTAMDEAIGEILDLLDEFELSDNTLVIFLSDNGGGGGADNFPLRGGKATMFEGGVRVPCIVRYPGHIPVGGKSDAFLTTLEIVPTVLRAAKVAPPKGLKLDGYDMLPVLAKGKESPRSKMFWKRRDDVAVRIGQWKWVRSKRGGGLFDLSKDIGESKDLSRQFPKQLERLQAEYRTWIREMEKAEPRGPFRNY